MVSKRRDEDDEDDVSLFLRLPIKPSNEDETDELGRSMDQGPHAPIRKARRAARDQRRITRSDSVEEGFSTDSELPSGDADDFDAALSQLRQRIAEVLSDVKMKDFKDARLAVAERFGDWRTKYGESYVGAWGGLGAVGSWEFWARLEMAGWDPLHESRNLDSFDWYTGLYNYSRPKTADPAGMVIDDEEEDDEPPLGPDGDLVTSMVSTAVIPRLIALIAGGAFDPYSIKDVRKVVDLVEQVEMCVPKEDLKYLVRRHGPSLRLRELNFSI